ncbi:MAG: hypothetical protein ACR2IV_10310 [Bryobacteraceae bacterium]
MSAWSDPQTIAAYIATGAAVAYTALTFGILRATSKNTTATRKILEAAYRPYVGVKSISVDFKTLQDAAIQIAIGNVGSVPAQAMEIEVEFTAFGGKKTVQKNEHRLAVLPESSFSVAFSIPNNDSRFLNQSGGMVRVIVNYRGATDQTYRSDEVFRYSGAPAMTFIAFESRLE